MSKTITPISNPLVTNVSIIEVQPLFNGVKAIPVPSDWESHLSPEMWGVIQSTKKFTIRQHAKLLPKQCCTCPPCVKQENSYSVFAGITTDSEAEFLRLDEVSDDWNRCCCAPYHPLKVEARQYIPLPGDGSKHSDYAWLKEDFKNDLKRFTDLRQAGPRVKDFYTQTPVLFTLQREDGQRCCCKMPCKWLSTFVCCGCCEDGMRVYAGPLPSVKGVESGRPVPHNVKLMGSAHQPQYAGCCTPTIHLKADDQSMAFGKVEGPVCFGGWSELCCDFKFFTSRFNSPSKSGDLALITKTRPNSVTQGALSVLTNGEISNFTIEFQDSVALSPSQKTTVLAAQILSDYMYFDGNTEKCHIDNEGNIFCYLFYCSIVGQLCPCCFVIPLSLLKQ